MVNKIFQLYGTLCQSKQYVHLLQSWVLHTAPIQVNTNPLTHSLSQPLTFWSPYYKTFPQKEPPRFLSDPSTCYLFSSSVSQTLPFFKLLTTLCQNQPQSSTPLIYKWFLFLPDNPLKNLAHT